MRRGFTERCGWAGDSLLAEVVGGKTPTYRLLDHEGSLAMATDGAGNVLGGNVFAPYGQGLNEQLGDAYSWAGLFQDTEYSGDAAWYRDYSARAGRWLTPDPYNGSYNTYRPQSFNRYMYVEGDPLGSVDPSGEAGAGIATGVGGSLCGTWRLGANLNPCNPLASVASIGIKKIFDFTQYSFASNSVTPILSFGITFGCGFASSSDAKSSFCGQSGWTSLFSKDHPDLATGINDGIAAIGLADGLAIASAASTLGESSTMYLATTCFGGGPANLACDVAIALIAYTALNDVFSIFWDAFGNGTPQFKGSLLPRPAALGGLGTASIGIPNHNLSLHILTNQ